MNEKEKQQIVAEVNILRELRHPCIVRYYDRIIDKKATKLYIVMEHCSGGDLASLIRSHAKNKTRADEGFIWKVLGQVVSALKSCHRHREGGEAKPILHRDLKPANILLDRNGNAKLCDFGLATELAGTNKLAQTAGVGTPYYMSPELVNSQRYDERSDIWSVGCIIYELAALRPPFDAPNQVRGRGDGAKRALERERKRALERERGRSSLPGRSGQAEGLSGGDPPNPPCGRRGRTCARPRISSVAACARPRIS
jgi:NIMA (never in mitosis gene a)-related kinase